MWVSVSASAPECCFKCLRNLQVWLFSQQLSLMFVHRVDDSAFVVSCGGEQEFVTPWWTKWRRKERSVLLHEELIRSSVALSDPVEPGIDLCPKLRCPAREAMLGNARFKIFSFAGQPWFRPRAGASCEEEESASCDWKQQQDTNTRNWIHAAPTALIPALPYKTMAWVFCFWSYMPYMFRVSSGNWVRKLDVWSKWCNTNDGVTCGEWNSYCHHSTLLSESLASWPGYKQVFFWMRNQWQLWQRHSDISLVGYSLTLGGQDSWAESLNVVGWAGSKIQLFWDEGRRVSAKAKLSAFCAVPVFWGLLSVYIEEKSILWHENNADQTSGS